MNLISPWSWLDEKKIIINNIEFRMKVRHRQHTTRPHYNNRALSDSSGKHTHMEEWNGGRECVCVGACGYEVRGGYVRISILDKNAREREKERSWE